MPEIVFGHGSRHLANTDLDREKIEEAIREDLTSIPIEVQRTLVVRRIMVSGVEIEFRAWLMGKPDQRGDVFPDGKLR